MKKMSKEEENADVFIKHLNKKMLGKQLYRNKLVQGKGEGGGCVYFATSPISLIVPWSHRLSFRHFGQNIFLELFPLFSCSFGKKNSLKVWELD